MVENRGQISHFLTPVKIRRGVVENAKWEDGVYVPYDERVYI